MERIAVVQLKFNQCMDDLGLLRMLRLKSLIAPLYFQIQNDQDMVTFNIIYKVLYKI